MRKHTARPAESPVKNSAAAVIIPRTGAEIPDAAEIPDVAVIGAGASGCMAAVSAAAEGAEVLLIDANDRICRKIYATGNGRCNLTNLRLSRDPGVGSSDYTGSDHADPGLRELYHVGGGEDLTAFFARFSAEDNIAFWESNGIRLHDRQGYVYPRTDQASTIAEAYEKILRRLKVRIVLSERVNGITKVSVRKDRNGSFCDVFKIETNTGAVYYARKVILAGGGMAGPQYGCGGDMYDLAAKFGHTVRKPLPALVQLLSDDKALKASSGVRCSAKTTLFITGEPVCSDSGELQMTEKGISGIPVFQLSSDAARALENGGEVLAEIDFLPEFAAGEWEREMERRLLEDRNCMLSVFFLGLVNRKILDLILRRRGLQAEKKASGLTDEDLSAIMRDMREFKVKITGTGTFAQAQVTSGGIPLSETDEDLQSKMQPGLYMAGELLDVDGLCGGYNLQWAATSGWIAGKGAAKENKASEGKVQK